MSDEGEGRDTRLPVPAARPHREIAPRAGSVISEFQPDAVELEERAPSRVARLTLYGVTALICSAVAWACLSSIDEIVVAPGKLITTAPTIVVQPLETSIIRSLDVSVGDVVQAGQTLATLDATFTQADVDQKRAKFAALDAQVRRLEAELGGVDYAVGANATADQILQMRLFAQRRAFYLAQVQNFDQQIAAQAAAIASNRDQEAILVERRDALARIENARETLYERQTGSLVNLLTSRNDRLTVDSGIAQLQGNTSEARHTLDKLKADRQAFIEDFRRAAMEQLVDLRGQRDTASEELKKMELRRSMVTLTAPADAVVLDLAQRSIGSVVREAEPIVTLVPLNVPLEAEVSVNARDIGRVSTGEPVRVKFDAFPFQKFGTGSGSIRTISRDAYPAGAKDGKESSAPPVFHARVALADTNLRGLTESVRFLPGMTVSAEIKVGRRKVVSYFLYPLLRGLDSAIKEP
jgi:HlyD family secretion protein